MKYLLALFIFSCSLTAQAGEILDASYEDKQFSSVALWAVGFSQKHREEIERDTLRTFEKKGIHAVAMLDLVPNVEQYRLSEVLEKVRDSGVETIFQLPHAGLNTSQHSGPINYVMRGGQMDTMTGKTNSNRVYKPSSTHGVWLWDSSTSTPFWTDEVTAEGHERSSPEYLAEKAFRLASRRAIKAGFFTPASKVAD